MRDEDTWHFMARNLIYRFQRARTTAISFSRLSMAFESMVSSVPFIAGDGLAVRYLP